MVLIHLVHQEHSDAACIVTLWLNEKLVKCLREWSYKCTLPLAMTVPIAFSPGFSVVSLIGVL